MNYIRIPRQITLSEIIKNNYSFSSLNYIKVDIKNNNSHFLRDLLDRNLLSSDKGLEVGSQSYISKSNFYFIRTKGLQSESLLPSFTSESVVPILPISFKNMNLREGDIIISKDSNIGETIILDKDYPNYMLSGGLYKLPLSKNKYYILGFMKSDFFKTQLNFMASKGSTIRHAKTLFLDCKIPFPNGKNSLNIINYFEILVQALINKEQEIIFKYNQINQLINQELNNGQKSNNFKFEYPTLEELLSMNRINAGIYSEYFKKQEFKIRNYKLGYKNIEELGFNISRGQNLQISAIGKSIYSDIKKPDFYTLILPKNLSLFGTVKKYEYLGNSNKLKTLKAGDIIFGAEGFEKGRSMVVFEDKDNSITNIHGITLNHSQNDITLSIFVKCFLDYLRNIKLIDLYAVGGNGGSLAQRYWDSISFPNFPHGVQKDIEKLYYFVLPYKDISMQNFLEEDKKWNKMAGLFQIDESRVKIKEHLDKIINNIIEDKDIDIDFSFLL